MAMVPLNVVMRNNATKQQITLGQQIDTVTLSTATPGGFGTFTFQIPERAARSLQAPLQAFYAADLFVTDQGGSTLFEGQLTDIKLHSDLTDAYYEIEATGWQILLDNPYRNIVIDTAPDWQQMPVSFNTSVVRPSTIPLTIGQVSASDATKIGWRCDVPSGTAITASWRNGAIAYYPVGTRLLRCKFDINTDMNRTAQFQLEIYCVDDSGNIDFLSSLATAFVGSSSEDIDLSPFSSLTRGIMMDFSCSTGGTSSADMWAQCTNFRVLSTRKTPTGTSVNEPVYGHEIISDIISKSPISQNFSNIEVDTSYSVPEFSFPVSDTCRNALDAITAYYNRYWAVWENKILTWKTWSAASAADWVVSRDSGAQVDIDPSITNAARVIIAQYTDAAGVAQETTITDTRADNVYALAGASKTAIVNLGITTTAAAATQVGAVYFPDHSYEVVGGTITLPAQARCFSQKYGTMLPAYKIRAGESVRLRDGNSVRSIFDSSSWNRSTLFRITATDLDWDNQSMQLTLDNSQASLDQITSRIQTNLSAKYGL